MQLLELMIPPTNRLGSSVGKHLACHGVVPGSILGLASLSSSYTAPSVSVKLARSSLSFSSGSGVNPGCVKRAQDGWVALFRHQHETRMNRQEATEKP